MKIDRRPLKLFIRLDFHSKDIPGSEVWRQKMPKQGRFREVTNAYLCCGFVNPDPTTTTTTTTSSTTTIPIIP